MRIYLDNCCYNRPFDNKEQERVHKEIRAIFSIFLDSKTKGVSILGSSILQNEISKITNVKKKANILSLCEQFLSETINIDNNVFNRSKEIMSNSNIKQMDALHLASAEKGNADLFVTVDDKLIKASKKIALNMKVINPVDYRRGDEND